MNSGTTDIQVPAQYSKLRFWRNTAVANLSAGQTATLAPGAGTLGYEWDADADNGFRPAGLFDMSSTTLTNRRRSSPTTARTREANSTATHHLTLYRAPSGALVFGAGTVQWSWGLDNPNGDATDPTMQQATVNLFADMGAQPYALISGLTAATASTDTTAPTSTITSPTAGANVADGTKMTVTGHGGRHRRCRRGRRGLHGRRHHLASGDRDHQLELQLGGARQPDRDHQVAGRRRQRQHPDPSDGRHRQRQLQLLDLGHGR